MKKIKILLIALFTLLVLAATIALPISVSYIQDQRLFGRIQTEPVSDPEEIASANLSVGEKLSLILDANDNKRNILLVDQTLKPDEYAITDDLKVQLRTALYELYEKGVLPKMDFDGVLAYSDISLKSYLDIDRPGCQFQFWEVDFILGRSTGSFWMDAQNLQIYQIQVKGVDTSDISLKQLFTAFGAYLDIQWSEDNFMMVESSLDKFSNTSKKAVVDVTNPPNLMKMDQYPSISYYFLIQENWMGIIFKSNPVNDATTMQ